MTDQRDTEGFETRLLAVLEDVDARTAPADRAAPFPAPVRRRLPRMLVPVAAAVAILTGAATAVAVFSNDPTFQAGAEAVESGGVVVAKGSGCGAGEVVTLRLEKTVLDRVTASDDGTFIAQVRLPEGTQPGVHALGSSCATADGEQLAQAIKLRVFSDAPAMGPSLAVAGAGTAGGTVHVKGSGCASTTVELSFDGRPAGTAAVLAGGTFSGDLPIPASADAGKHEVVARCFAPSGEPLVQTVTLDVVPATAEEPPASKG